jgi:hypothetical protein
MTHALPLFTLDYLRFTTIALPEQLHLPAFDMLSGLTLGRHGGQAIQIHSTVASAFGGRDRIQISDIRYLISSRHFSGHFINTIFRLWTFGPAVSR